MTYYAQSPIKHNGTLYVKGDVVPVSDEQAESLISDGVLSDFPVKPDEVPAEAAPEAPERREGPSSGAEVTETGEPSLDAQRAAQSGPARDVTADQQGADERKPGFIQRAFGAGEAKVTHVVTAEDLEAHPTMAENGIKQGDVLEGTPLAKELAEEAAKRAEAADNAS